VLNRFVSALSRIVACPSGPFSVVAAVGNVFLAGTPVRQSHSVHLSMERQRERALLERPTLLAQMLIEGVVRAPGTCEGAAADERLGSCTPAHPAHLLKRRLE
jgi:hypothetical protein